VLGEALDEAESRDLLARGYREALEREDVARVVRFGFWIGHFWINDYALPLGLSYWAPRRS
jgi:hypothetical protein